MTSASCPSSATLAGRSWLGRRQLSTRAWLVAFTLFVCGAIVTAFTFDRLHARDVAVAHARVQAQNLAQSLSDEASDTFEAVGAAQAAIADRLEAEGTSRASRLRLRDAMAALVASMPRLHALNYLDERGRFVVGSLTATSGWLPPVADRPYFRYHRDHPGRTVHISGPARSHLDATWAIFVTRRVDAADGRFAGVLVSPLTLDYFERSYAGVDVGRAGSIELVGDDARLMARKPRAFIGRLFPRDPVFTDPYRYLQAGAFVRPSPRDGVTRLVAFQRLGSYPLLIEVALAESEYLADWRTDTLHGSITLAIVLLMIGGLAAVLGAQFARRERAETDLSRLALIDGLTDLANRRQFDATFDREWRRAVRDRTPISLLMIDVDNFKSYNDEHGHQRGDDVLRAIADAIRRQVQRPSDVPARYGGEEFAVILPVTDRSSACVVAERILNAVAALAIPHVDAPHGITSVSIGVASVVPSPFAPQTVLVEAADRALYDAKDGGRDRICVACDAVVWTPSAAAAQLAAMNAGHADVE